jgi:putative nucleic acid binding protein
MTSFRGIHWNFVIALGLMFVVVAACNRSRKSSLPSGPRETKAAEAAPSGELTAEALFQEYQKDKEAADRKYKGQLVTVTGTVDKVKIGPSGDPYVTMKTSSLVLRVQCLFKKTDESTVARLQEGQPATLRGKVYGRIGNVVLDSCQIQ